MTNREIDGTNRKRLFQSDAVSPVQSVSKQMDEVYDNPSIKYRTKNLVINGPEFLFNEQETVWF